jgi:hypothetical protein
VFFMYGTARDSFRDYDTRTSLRRRSVSRGPYSSRNLYNKRYEGPPSPTKRGKVVQPSSASNKETIHETVSKDQTDTREEHRKALRTAFNPIEKAELQSQRDTFDSQIKDIPGIPVYSQEERERDHAQELREELERIPVRKVGKLRKAESWDTEDERMKIVRGITGKKKREMDFFNPDDDWDTTESENEQYQGRARRRRFPSPFREAFTNRQSRRDGYEYTSRGEPRHSSNWTSHPRYSAESRHFEDGTLMSKEVNASHDHPPGLATALHAKEENVDKVDPEEPEEPAKYKHRLLEIHKQMAALSQEAFCLSAGASASRGSSDLLKNKLQSNMRGRTAAREAEERQSDVTLRKQEDLVSIVPFFFGFSRGRRARATKPSMRSATI